MPKQRVPDQTGIITSKEGRVGGAELSGGSGLSELSGISRSGVPAVSWGSGFSGGHWLCSGARGC